MMTPPTEPFLWAERQVLDISDFTLRRWLRDGHVRRVLTGVYCSSELPDTSELRARCAALLLPPGSVLCDRSAAWLWGVDVHDPDERFTITDLEIAVPPARTAPRRIGVIGVRRDLEPDETTQLRGIHLTTPVRTAIDLACRRGRWRALATLDAFKRECGLTTYDYGRQLLRHGGRRGVSQAREWAPLSTELAESPGESWTRGAIHDAGLQMPEPQIEIFEDGFLGARIDLGYRHRRVAVEYDGEEFHGEEQRAHDDERREWLHRRGWHVVVVRKHQLKGAAREAWLDELGAVLAERGHRGKQRYARRPEPWIRG